MRNACKQDEIQRGKMVFLTIESANKAEITILSAPDTMNVLGIYCISGLHMVYQLRMYA